MYEEVEVGKRPVQETERVSGTVRREEARLEREGEVAVPGWDEVSSNYRAEWQQRHGASGRRWEDVEPGYRYAHEMRSDPRYRDRNWSDVESDLQSGYSDWSRGRGYRHDDGGAWARLREDVREAWEERRR